MESPEKGHRCIRDDLERYHKINVSDKRILRICRIKGIKSTIKYANTGCTRQASIPQHIAENLLNREFHAHRPNEKWLTDVTEFKWYEGNEIRKVYLSAILDLYDRRIVSFVIGNRNDNPLVFDTFHKAVESNPGAQPLFHSDRGYQYTNRGFHQKQIRVSDRRQPFEDTLFGRDRCDEKLESKPQRLRGNPLPVGDLLRGQTGLSILK
jgi:transposase InsO family protein